MYNHLLGVDAEKMVILWSFWKKEIHQIEGKLYSQRVHLISTMLIWIRVDLEKRFVYRSGGLERWPYSSSPVYWHWPSVV